MIKVSFSGKFDIHEDGDEVLGISPVTVDVEECGGDATEVTIAINHKETSYFLTVSLRELAVALAAVSSDDG